MSKSRKSLPLRFFVTRNRRNEYRDHYGRWQSDFNPIMHLTRDPKKFTIGHKMQHPHCGDYKCKHGLRLEEVIFVNTTFTKYTGE